MAAEIVTQISEDTRVFWYNHEVTKFLIAALEDAKKGFIDDIFTNKVEGNLREQMIGEVREIDLTLEVIEDIGHPHSEEIRLDDERDEDSSMPY